MVVDPLPDAASLRGELGSARVYAPGERIDRYEVLGLVGRGGMALVYAVRRRGVGDFERTLALKMMLPHLVDDEAYLAMFLDEIRIVSRIDHANVVRVLDVGEHQGSPFMVMELLRGRTLAACLDKRAPRALVAHWLAEVGEGLHAAHEARDTDGTWLRIVHRDVSAANVHVGLDGRARVLDFGIAGAVGRATSTRHGELKGRLSLMAPEAITRAAPLDRRADVWSLGVVAWEAFAGASLFQGENEAETLWRVLNAPVPRLPDDVPAEVRAAIATALERSPSKRLGTTAELSRVLAGHAREVGASAEVASEWMRRNFHELTESPAERAPDTEPDAGATRKEDALPIVAAGELAPPRRPLVRVIATSVVLGALLGGGALAWLRAGDAVPSAAARGADTGAIDGATPREEPAIEPRAEQDRAQVAAPVEEASAPVEREADAEPSEPEAAPAREPEDDPRPRVRRGRRATTTERATEASPRPRVDPRLLDSPYDTGG